MASDDDLMAQLGLGKLIQSATVEVVDLNKFRTVDEAKWSDLVSCRWLQLHQNTLILGPSGIGKTFVANALSHKAVRDGYSVHYTSGMRLLQALAGPWRTATRRELSALTSRKDLLVIDDFSFALLSEKDQLRLVITFLGDHQFHSSLLLVTNLPLAQWYHYCSPTIASQIDRIIARSHVLELKTKPCLR